MARNLRATIIKNEQDRLEIAFRDELESKLDGMDMPDFCKDLCYKMCAEAYRNGLDDLGQIWIEKEQKRCK